MGKEHHTNRKVYIFSNTIKGVYLEKLPSNPGTVIAILQF